MKKSEMINLLQAEMTERGYYFDATMAVAVLEVCDMAEMQPPRYYRQETKPICDEAYDERYHTIGFYQNGWEDE